MIEPEIHGDPVAMRALAQELVARADLLVDIPSGFGAALDGSTFEGGAAARLRETARVARGRVAALAGELRDVATALYADATSVELDNEQARAEQARDDHAQVAGEQDGMAAR